MEGLGMPNGEPAQVLRSADAAWKSPRSAPPLPMSRVRPGAAVPLLAAALLAVLVPPIPAGPLLLVAGTVADRGVQEGRGAAGGGVEEQDAGGGGWSGARWRPGR